MKPLVCLHACMLRYIDYDALDVATDNKIVSDRHL
mgnify:CR=1 FL=1